MTEDFADIEEWVRAEFAAARQPGVVDLGEVAPHPHRSIVACTVSVRVSDEVGTTQHVAVVDLVSSTCRVLELGLAASYSPAWSPDGEQLALLAVESVITTALIVDIGGDTAAPDVVHRLPGVDGSVEAVSWSPDGTRLGVLVAQFGAEVSDVYGSGVVAAPTAAAPWRPLVSPSPERGRRILHLWAPGSGSVTGICPDLNVWEHCWLGTDRLVVLASRAAGEGAWYAAGLHTLGTETGEAVAVHRPDAQLAKPRGDPSGARWSVIAGPASDRGLLAGALFVSSPAGVLELALGGVDVSDQAWLDERRILYVGLRGLTTVFGVVDVETGSYDELLAGEDTNGLHQPELGGLSVEGDLVVALERHDQPPVLSLVTPHGPRTVLSSAGPGTDHVLARTGSTRPCTWTSSDGLAIEGLLTVPESPGPHPLIVNIHGGPVAAWHDGWIGKDPYAMLLAARGFAVLRPNPRGSVGRGKAFVEGVIGDMGGADVDDVVSGVQAMLADGVTTPGRVGITGNSYGGYLAAWVPCCSEVFSASVARSPVTDWRSQHLTGNLAEFDEAFVDGDPFDPASQYATRSPLTHFRRIRTPMLLTAGQHDLATPASQALQLHRALLTTGVPTRLAIYPLEGHGVRAPDALTDQLARMIQWFETYL
ncbi:S9 family peptidase [Nocardioides sp.]|uniref:S9 family peptidase n=1 Tax=Nocardioides sp. TaxID=35761 RepID=UPI003D131400